MGLRFRDQSFGYSDIGFRVFTALGTDSLKAPGLENDSKYKPTGLFRDCQLLHCFLKGWELDREELKVTSCLDSPLPTKTSGLYTLIALLRLVSNISPVGLVVKHAKPEIPNPRPKPYTVSGQDASARESAASLA